MSVSEQAPSPASVAEPVGTGDDDHARLMRGEGGVYPDLDVLDRPVPRENFIPVSSYALIDRLSLPEAWPNEDISTVRRFFKYLDYWRHQQYTAQLVELEHDYEVFSPDSDLLQTRDYTDAEKTELKKKIVEGVRQLLIQANYSRIDPSHVEEIMAKETHYGLDLSVELSEFEELEIYFRGASNRVGERRSIIRFFRKEEFEVPIFRRLFVLFKLKSFDTRVTELMTRYKLTRKAAEKQVTKQRAMLPSDFSADNIYMKLFKNMPRSDIEMAFPNTRVRFRMLDKIKLGVTSSAGLGMGVFGLIGKAAVIATNPIAAAGACATLGGVAFRQAMSYLNQRQRYMVVMAQNLYFHALADNRSAIMTLAGRAAAEDVKEDILLYSALAQGPINRQNLKTVDKQIEQYLKDTFLIDVDFDDEEALGRLMADGLVTEAADGTLHATPPKEAALHLDSKWDLILDLLPETTARKGREIELKSVEEGKETITPAPDPA